MAGLKLLTEEANHFVDLLLAHLVFESRHAIPTLFDLLEKLRVGTTQRVSFAQAGNSELGSVLKFHRAATAIRSMT